MLPFLLAFQRGSGESFRVVDVEIVGRVMLKRFHQHVTLDEHLARQLGFFGAIVTFNASAGAQDEKNGAEKTIHCGVGGSKILLVNDEGTSMSEISRYESNLCKSKTMCVCRFPDKAATYQLPVGIGHNDLILKARSSRRPIRQFCEPLVGPSG